MVDGSANNPYASTSAISDGNRARKPKKATPAPSSGIWSSVVCAQLRLRIWSQPRPGDVLWALRLRAGSLRTGRLRGGRVTHVSC